MNTQRRKRAVSRGIAALTVIMLGIFCLFLQPANAHEDDHRAAAPETIKAIIIGDRVVDIAYKLGILPNAMSVRCSIWSMCEHLKVASQVLGCPNFTTAKKKETIPTALKKFGINRVIVEKRNDFCLYKPNVKPENIVPILAGMDVTIEYVDFSNGLETAVRQTARLLGHEEMADELIEDYTKDLAEVKSLLPASKLDKRVIILSSAYQSSKGTSVIRVEAPGGYSDRFLLEPLGCVNVGDAFKPVNGKTQKGHYPVVGNKDEMLLAPLIKANPDVIVITGDAYAVQKALREQTQKNPALADVTAIKNWAVYSLPFYVDSSVLEYPTILRQWAAALND